MTHSTEFVTEMKAALLEEKASLEKELGFLAQKRSGDYQADMPDYGRNDEDNATEAADYQAAYSTTETMETRLREVLEALERIDNDTYGVTDAGELIPEERLRANPAAKTIIRK